MALKIKKGMVFRAKVGGAQVAVVVNNTTDGIHIKDTGTSHEWLSQQGSSRRRKVSKATLERSYEPTDLVCREAVEFKLPSAKKVVAKKAVKGKKAIAKKAVKGKKVLKAVKAKKAVAAAKRGRPSKLEKLKKMCRPGRPSRKA